MRNMEKLVIIQDKACKNKLMYMKIEWPVVAVNSFMLE